MCEADARLLGKRPYDVQILGGIAMFEGYLAEMNTGEGKTLMATMPLYLSALTGQSTMLVTSNDYLAARDAEEMGAVYNFLGLTVSAGLENDADGDRPENDAKREVYSADIVYTTHGAVGFDYLFNNLVKSADDRFMRDFGFVIIDEADSVLLDAAQTPLVVSGAPRVQSNLYQMADFFVRTLVEDEDYILEDGMAWLTVEGAERAETYFGIDNFYSEEHFEINRHVILALRAHKTMELGKDYVISEKNELALLDGGSGRVMQGVKLRGGIHQALEVKEGLDASQDNRSMASVTFQNLFLMFPHMAGMSGTLADARDELRDIYKKEVVVIPPNRPMARKDLPDKFYRSNEEMLEAAIDRICSIHATGQPVLVVASTLVETEFLSKLLLAEKVPHSVLNANNAYWEAQMIKEAGQLGAVTVATSIAGRGTDIKLGEGVRELGGLAVIGVGRMANTRSERQARGRSGRQGDPGFSEFYVSLEDDTVYDHAGYDLDKYIEGKRRISKRRLKKIINNCQANMEESAAGARKSAVQYDEVLQRQRDIMYETRNRLLDGGSLTDETLISIFEYNIDRFINAPGHRSAQDVSRYILDHITYGLKDSIGEDLVHDGYKLEEYLCSLAQNRLAEQRESIGSQNAMYDFIRLSALSAIDEAWIEEVDYLQQIQYAVSGRATAQRNPVFEYQEEAYESFEKMKDTIYLNVMRNILLSEIFMDKKGQIRMVTP